MLSSSTTATPGEYRHAYDGMLEEAGDIVFRLNLLGQILYASRRSASLIGHAAPLEGQTLPALVCDRDQAALKAALAELAQSQGVTRVDARLRTGDSEVWFELRMSCYTNGGGVPEVLVVGRDLTVQHATEERLRHMATHDALTELPNRLLLTDRIRMTIAQARRSGQGFSVATIGLDSFKKVNDGLGHPIGDAVLKMAATRLRKTLRDSDTLARVGGDEFVAVLPGTFTEQQIRLVTGRLLATLQSPFEIDQHTIYVGASIGVSVYPQHAEDEIRLVALADAAMSRAKETGKARCVVYSPRHNGPTEHDISLEAAMFQAVREGEFMLYYQPIVDARTREIEGFETLMRWKHPTLGMVPPARFVPIAETNGLINLLGAWALKAACVQIRQFEEAAKRPLYISVNISPRQFRNDKFLEVLDDALSYSGLPGEQLVLEITEGTLMIDPVHAETILGKMAERRARIAIDDFGIGYSNLDAIGSLPFDRLKVDRRFVHGVADSAVTASLFRLIQGVAEVSDAELLCEGLERVEDLDWLRHQHAYCVQGWYFSSALPAEGIEDLLRTWHHRAPPADVRELFAPH